MASKAELEFYALAEKHGIEVDFTAGHIGRGWGGKYQPIPYFIMCDAPHGFVFANTELHCDGRIQGDDGTIKANWRQAKEQLQELINDGIVPCPHGAECEYCHPEEE
jgi:hypothetical protein